MKRRRRKNTDEPQTAYFRRLAVTLVYHGFRNNTPLEALHSECRQFTDAKMKELMKASVDNVFSILRVIASNPEAGSMLIRLAAGATNEWDPPNDISTEYESYAQTFIDGIRSGRIILGG